MHGARRLTRRFALQFDYDRLIAERGDETERRISAVQTQDLSFLARDDQVPVAQGHAITQTDRGGELGQRRRCRWQEGDGPKRDPPVGVLAVENELMVVIEVEDRPAECRSE